MGVVIPREFVSPGQAGPAATGLTKWPPARLFRGSDSAVGNAPGDTVAQAAAQVASIRAAAPPLQALRETVRRLERGSGRSARLPASLDFAPIDSVLGAEGLAADALHEVMTGRPGNGARTAAHDAASLAFAALLLGRLAVRDGPAAQGRILWCRRAGGGCDSVPYAPALAAFFDPARLLLAETRRDEETLWAMEEGLRCGSLAAVLGEIDVLPPLAGRRLQLAAERSGVPGVLLRGGDRPVAVPGIVATRWRIVSRPSQLQTTAADDDLRRTPRWQIELLRHRCSDPGRSEIPTWTVEWIDETCRLALVAASDNRSAGAAATASAAEPSRVAARPRLAG